MKSLSAGPKHPTSRRILVLDVGGSHVKFRVGPKGRIAKFVSGPKMTPRKMTRALFELLPQSSYDAVSIGYPGVVLHGRIAAEPHNLGHGWVHVDLERLLGAPVRVINDAAMQAIGSYAGGRMLFLGLGTGLGATLIVNGVVEPMEIGHLPYRHGRTFEDYVGEKGRTTLGNKKWRKVVAEVVVQLAKVLESDYVVIGGGNARRLKRLPPHCRLGDNRNALIGGLRIWQHATDPLQLVSQRATRRAVDRGSRGGRGRRAAR